MKEAGLPDGVINWVPGAGNIIGDVRNFVKISLNFLRFYSQVPILQDFTLLEAQMYSMESSTRQPSTLIIDFTSHTQE
jgi:hypothetical protein